MSDWIYDIESFPNFFSFYATNATADDQKLFEISWRRNDVDAFLNFMNWCAGQGDRHVGFNNMGYDYPILHWIMRQPRDQVNALTIYRKSKEILGTAWNQRFQHRVWDDDHVVPQIDLFMLHHFDNMARSTSLKELQFNMRSDSVMESTVPFDKIVTFTEMDEIIAYNIHDTDETLRFYDESIGEIKFREELSGMWGKNILNHNATKIGKEHFIDELQKRSPGSCYEPGTRTKRQTIRDSIALNDVIFDYVKFDHPELNRVLAYLKSQVIVETKGVFKNLTATVNGFDFDFGTGGIHGAVDNSIWRSDEDYTVEMRDVVSYYPSLAIANRIHPAHLGEVFCDVYEELFNERRRHAKGTTENAALKLALNGTFGDTNSKYSPLFDPQYAMQITINGQLLLCMLSENLMRVDGLQMIQVNTDGVAIYYPRKQKPLVDMICTQWEVLTKLELETDEYVSLFQRDCNNYIGVQE